MATPYLRYPAEKDHTYQVGIRSYATKRRTYFSKSTHFEKTLQTVWPGCEVEQESRFEIKVLHFSEKLPTLQSTNQSYCDYLQ